MRIETLMLSSSSVKTNNTFEIKMINFFWIILALVLVLVNAFFVAAEFGMVRLRHTRIEVLKDKKGLQGKILYEIHTHLDAYLSACQVGITLASLGLGWIGEPAFAELFGPVFQYVGFFSENTIKVISFFIAFSLISFLHIVVGELMPKSLAIRQSETVSLWTAIPLYIFYWGIYPVIWILNGCSNFFLRKIKLHHTHKGESFYSTQEIKSILNASHFHGELTEDETEIIEHTLDFADLKVTDVMRPKKEMVALKIQHPIEKSLKVILEHRYSRYPIYDNKTHQIIGIIHVKDLFAKDLEQPLKIKSLKPFIRPVLKVSEKLPALDLLRKFREGMPHFALVYEKKKNLLGFVTLDNLLHILVGRIKDEFHKTRDDWVLNKDGTLSFKGTSSIYMLERALDIDLPLEEDEEDTIETIRDFVLSKDKAPKKGDRLFFKEFDLIVEKIKENEILKVRVYPKNKGSSKNDGPTS